MAYEYDHDCPFEAYITNLGKYNEGELVGEWVKFPTTSEDLEYGAPSYKKKSDATIVRHPISNHLQSRFSKQNPSFLLIVWEKAAYACFEPFDPNIIKMLGSKGILTPLIPDCSALYAPAIFKNIRNSLIFL